MSELTPGQQQRLANLEALPTPDPRVDHAAEYIASIGLAGTEAQAAAEHGQEVAAQARGAYNTKFGKVQDAVRHNMGPDAVSSRKSAVKGAEITAWGDASKHGGDMFLGALADSQDPETGSAKTVAPMTNEQAAILAAQDAEKRAAKR